MSRLEERAATLATPLRPQRPDVDAVLVTVRGETFAAPLRQLRAVLPAAITPLPLSAPHVAGVQTVRGSLVGVVRADALLTGQPGGAPGPLARVLLAATQPEPCGVLVDAVGDLVWVGEPVAPATFGTPGVRGRTGSGVACLDLDALVRHLPPAWPARPPDSG
ncbi:chemotaxis protein CheW [Deinococcus sp. JMULE3]|uniref:chemotaxis protein CheW n=1 Tax=Deinococcus sp. JMULE3 TaxID=2518341 RepID=UPI001575B77B